MNRALSNVFGTQLFERVQVYWKPCYEEPQFFDIEILVKERPAETAEIEAEWKLDRGVRGFPIFTRLVPGGALIFDHRNLGGRGSQLSTRIDTGNFLKPLDDLGFKVVLEQPYFFGTEDPNKRSLCLIATNTRKLSSVFMPKPGIEIPPVFIDRTGLKASLKSSYKSNRKGSLSLIIESISCSDESGSICINGTTSTNDATLLVGPPTTISGLGSDKVISIQSDFVRDTTFFRKN